MILLWNSFACPVNVHFPLLSVKYLWLKYRILTFKLTVLRAYGKI